MEQHEIEEFAANLADNFDTTIKLAFLGINSLVENRLPEDWRAEVMYQLCKVLEEHSDVLWNTLAASSGQSDSKVDDNQKALSKKHH